MHEQIVSTWSIQADMPEQNVFTLTIQADISEQTVYYPKTVYFLYIFRQLWLSN